MDTLKQYKVKTHPSRSRRLSVIVTMASLLLALVIGLWNGPSLLAYISSHFVVSQPEKATNNSASIEISRSGASTSNRDQGVPQEYQLATKTTANQYMNALLHQQYNTMWALLQPDIQAMWPDEASFASFWQARFQDYTLQRFTMGNVGWLQKWIDPETMIEYDNVLEIPVSLVLQPDQTILDDPQAPPEDVHPSQLYQNLPFIVQRMTGRNDPVAHWFVLDGGPADPEAPILPPIHPASTYVEVPILMYHHISDVIPSDILGMSLTVKDTLFNQQLDYLKQQGYHTITYNQLFNALYFHGPLPSHPIILTFDDGYSDVYQFAFPALRAHGYTGMFFIITGRVGQAGYLSWQEISNMHFWGMQIGSHTIHHVDMGQMLLVSRTLAQQELQESKATLGQHLGITIQQFCYPSGEPFKTESLALQQEIVTLLAADGYIGGTTDPGQTGFYQNSLAPFDLLRVRVDGRSSLLTFEQELPW